MQSRTTRCNAPDLEDNNNRHGSCLKQAIKITPGMPILFLLS
jgi:hypothetical protein